MDKFKTILFLAIFPIAFYACKKESHAEIEENNKTCLMSKQFAKDDTTTYEYNNLGRVIRSTRLNVAAGSNFKSTETFDYTYTPNQIISKGKTSSGPEFADTLNVKDGLVMEAINILTQHTNQYSERTRSQRFFIYNNEGYVTKDSTIRVISYSNRMYSDTAIIVANYIYKDGNLSRLNGVFSTLKNNVLEVLFRSTSNYEYYTDKLNTVHDKTDFIFKPNRNLIKRIAVSYNGSIDAFNYNYSYEFDKNGLVTRSIEKYDSGYVTSDFGYEYVCK